MFRLSFVMLAGVLLLSCAKENQFELPLEHQTLAIKLGANDLGKPPATFTKKDSMQSFFAFNYYLKDALKEYPKPEPNTPEHFSLLLMRLWSAMDAVLMRDAFDMRDSLDTSTFFSAFRFSAPLSSQKKLLGGGASGYRISRQKCKQSQPGSVGKPCPFRALINFALFRVFSAVHMGS